MLESDKNELVVGSIITYNGDIYIITSIDDIGYGVRCINPTNDSYATHISFEAEIKTIDEECWKPERRKIYWYLGDGLQVLSELFSPDDLRDIENISIGNCFKSRAIAKKAREEVIKALVEFHRRKGE